jgi:uncharacterized protein DUF4071
VYAAKKPLPFDVALLRTQEYKLGRRNSFPDTNAKLLRQQVRTSLRELSQVAREESATDSPLFLLVNGWKPEPLTQADSFHEQLKANEGMKQRLNDIRAMSNDKKLRPRAAAALDEIREEVLGSGTTDAGVLTSLMLGYRALSDWTGMIDVYGQLPKSLQKQVTVRQQLAFAYNRRAEDGKNPADRERALKILQQLKQQQGPTSETSGLIGRIYKSQWAEALDHDEPLEASGHLRKAIAAYVEGFETDWRDIYPGINAITLLDIQGDKAGLKHKDQLLPLVRFAVQQRLRTPVPEYWDYATLLEIAVLDNDATQAVDALGDVLTASTEAWQRASTAGNLRMIERARRERGNDTGWLSQIIDKLDPPAKKRTRKTP